MDRVNSRSGFTVIELLVTMAVASIVVASVVGFVTYFVTNIPLTNARNKVSGDLQSGMQQIASYIRSSDNVLLYNLSPDDNAPSSRQDEATKVPGPDSIPADNDYRYYWRSTANQLVMARPSRNVSGAPIYTDPANNDYSGPRDSIALYVKNNALYARTVYTSQSANTTLTCSGTTVTGGCDGDIRLVDNLKTVSGKPQFTVTYYDSMGNEIPAMVPDPNDPDHPINNYNARKLTRSVKIDITLEVLANSRKVTVSDSSTISFRTGYIPGSTVIGSNNGSAIGTGGTAPPWSLAGNMYIGPGGLTTSSISKVYGTGLNIMGRLTTNSLAKIGTAAAPLTITVANQACGVVGTTWPTTCPTEPITGTVSWGTGIFGKVCATGQTTGTGMANTGLQVGCVAPSIIMPSYDRQAFVDSMKTQQPANNGSCSLANFAPKTLGPDVQYNGSLTNDYILCKMTIKGNIYVMGDLNITAGLTLKVDESVGLKRPVVVVDGSINFAGLLQSVVLNTYGTGIDFISFKSSNASCLATPACRDRTDQSLLNNSYNQTTVNVESLQAPGSTFYAYYGGLSVGLLANIGNVSGQTVTVGGGTIQGF